MSSDLYYKLRKSESQSDAQGGDEPIDMEGQEETETSRKVNVDDAEPDHSDERIDERID